MRKTITKTVLMLAAFLLLLQPAYASAQNKNDENSSKSYYAGVFGKPSQYNADKYAAGPEEQKYYAVTDWDGVPMQQKYQEVTDAVLEQFVANTDAPPYDLINPAGWMAAVHYPTATGNADVDDVLARQAHTFFTQTLPAYDKISAALDPASWPAPGKANKDDNAFNPDQLQFFISYLAKQLQLSQNEAYAYPAKDAGPILPAITVYNIAKPQDRYLSVIFTSWVFGGGAHDFWQAHALSFDLEKGKQLTLDDLMPSQAAIDKLQAKLADMDKTRRGDSDYMQTFNDNKYPELDMHRMALTPEGLMIIFDPYEIGSFAEGSIIFNISKDELKAIGANTAYWK